MLSAQINVIIIRCQMDIYIKKTKRQILKIIRFEHLNIYIYLVSKCEKIAIIIVLV